MFGSSHISHHDLQRPVDQAKEVLQGSSAKGIETLWNWLGAVFQLWKSEHGQAPHQGGLLGRGPSPEFFDEAKPYECAGLGISNSIDLALKLWGDSYEPFLKVIETATLERVLAVLILKEATPVNAASVFRASELLHKIKEAYNKLVMDQLTPLAAAGLKQKRNLSSGQEKGAAANKKRAEEMNVYWRSLASGLVKDNPGWTVDGIVAHIKKRYVVKKINGKPWG